MHAKSRLLLLGAVVTLVLAIGVGAAAALRSLEFNAMQVTGTSRAITFAGGGIEVICEITINGTVNARSIAKTRGTAIGRSEARIATERCRGGRLRVLAETEPWTNTYDTFTGTLPSIRSIRSVVSGVAFLVSAFGGLGECLYRGNVAGSTGPSEGFRETIGDESVQIPLSRNLGGFFCPEEGSMRGMFSFERTLTVRLI